MSFNFGPGPSWRRLLSPVMRAPSVPDYSYAISQAATFNAATGQYTFTMTRGGADLSSGSSHGWQASATTMPGLTPATAADFGGGWPSGTCTFGPGETEKTFTITAPNFVGPE